ncbi:hypothetical protein [Papillibacter cinnamivorans]|uniref:Uncharacterized protein n=1 Tax=Papillibacter cinnamivorans DSM 12816 TaxID=1122930 RepID=A0A1W2AXK1_9FIRM|nr:hypothetical protein [Papillibacter cinnamivorans]SMC65191.1 hypothetical protein SAMN02745168_2014 [Papillibacter cinnamivorans DSM 12816]
MKIKKKLLSILMTAALVLSLLPGLTLPATAWAAPVICGGFEVTGDSNYSFSGNTLTFSGDGTCVVKLASKWLATTNQIVVSSGTVNITLSDVIVNASGCAFTVASGATVNLTLSGTNALIGCGSGYDGLQVESGATLTITSSTGGSLTATGSDGGAGGDGGAGIGGDGDISISGSAHVEATGSSGGDGGVGDGSGGDGGAGIAGNTISISGSAYVKATGGNGGAGGNAGYGGSGGDGGDGGVGIDSNSISISGSAQVRAAGGFGGGGGISYISDGGDGGDAGAGIDGDTINISGSAQVTATGSYGGTGGSAPFGVDGTGGNDAAGIGSSGSSITISGGFVTATGTDTDTSYDISGSSVTITGGSVYLSRNKVNPLPTDGSDRVYLVYVTGLAYAASAATSYSINGGSALSTNTVSSGILYLWLPATESSTEILLNAGGKEYKAAGDKISYVNATDMFALNPPLAAKFVLTPCGNGTYFVKSDGDSAYTGSYNDESFLTLTVDSGVTGFKYFGVDITVAETGHSGTETCVFVQTRNGVQIAINATTADFDTVGTATAGFNVKPGDVIEVYIVDSLTNGSGTSPTVL